MAGEPVRLRAYAGRWVALVQGRVAGVGLTAEAARAAAQLSRPKEKAQVLFVPEHPELAYPDILRPIRSALPADARVWLVGGAIRDALLQHRIRDLDFVVDGEARRAARSVANALAAAFYPLDAERDVGRVIVSQADERFTLDFARLRGATIADDLAARDFTINAIAAPVANPDELLDPLGGAEDLKAKLVRACSPASIADDPVRGIRAVRLAAQLNFRLERETRSAIRAQAAALSRVSAERQRDEFIRCLGGPRPSAAVRALDMLGLLGQLVPELAALKGVAQPPPHALDVWEHTLAAVDQLSDVLSVLQPVHDVDAASDLTLGLISLRLGRHREALASHLGAILSGDRPARWMLMLAALLHDVGKPATRTVEPGGRIRFLNHEIVGAEMAARRLTRLRFSSDEIERVRTIVAHHLRPILLAQESAVTRRAVYRFFRDAGEAGVDVALLALGDVLAMHGAGPPPQEAWARQVDVCAQLTTAFFEHAGEQVAPPALITGHDLIGEFGMEAGPEVGQMLEAVREAQAAGEIANRGAALNFVRQRLAEK